MAEFDVASAVVARLPRAHGRRIGDRARWWANAGVATAFLFLGGQWVSGYLDREQAMRVESEKARSAQHVELVRALAELKGEVHALTNAINAAGVRTAREPAP